MPLSTSRSVPGGMPTAAKASPRSIAACASASVCGADRHAECAARVQRLDDPAAEFAQIVVDDRDRNLAQDLVQIGLRIVDAVDQRRQDQQDEGAAHSRARAAIRPAKAPPMPRGAAAAARCPAAALRSQPLRARVAQAQQRQQRKEQRQSRQRREGNGGIRDRQAPRRLSEQHGHVPAQRQDRAPGLRKGIHGDASGKPTPA